jgi:hypothetical protein
VASGALPRPIGAQNSQKFAILHDERGVIDRHAIVFKSFSEIRNPQSRWSGCIEYCVMEKRYFDVGNWIGCNGDLRVIGF